MQKLSIPNESCFSDLELHKFDELKYALYVIDHNWNYLFVNSYVKQNLGARGADLIGKNMWEQFDELAKDAAFMKMKGDIEKRHAVNFTTTSPVTGQRLNIVGYSLKDCYFFYASQLPNKDELLSELRTVMNNS